MRIITPLAFVLTALPLMAAPISYNLDAEASRVAFTYTLAGADTRGRMPVQSADIAIDFDDLTQSRVAATLDADRATAGLIFATEAMKAPSVLATAQFPTITFTSTAVRPNASGAKIDGMITIRDVTRPITLDARIFRQRGTDAGDRSRLTIQLTGRVNRSAFRAGGYPELVGDEILLDIVTRIDRDIP